MCQSPAFCRPKIGRIVHYVSLGTPVRDDGTQAFPSACRSATVTEIDKGNPKVVGLHVENPTGGFYHPLDSGGCEYVAKVEQPPTGGTWHSMEECED
ncbi:hypothetical protein [Streptomyces olivochromogenes]|uniref:hypothetical protein n=1 Tax=Streptomyces olivochromogenes TaxID=1963 RepID=UPI0036AB05BE